MVLYSLYTPFITWSTQQGTACQHERIFKIFAHFGHVARLLRKKTKHNFYPQKTLANSFLGTSSATIAVWVYMIFKLKLTFSFKKFCPILFGWMSSKQEMPLQLWNFQCSACTSSSSSTTSSSASASPPDGSQLVEKIVEAFLEVKPPVKRIGIIYGSF